MNDGLTKENLLLIIPPALKQDPSIMALAAADAEALAARLAEIDRVRLIPNIDALDEAVLDILARDFKVDWWDPEYSLNEKRQVLKSSWRVHKTLGTKAAVETALRAIYPKAAVREWFEYGGEPYCFKLDIDLTGEISDAARPWRVIQRVGFYKSLRSHMDEIVFTFVLPPAPLHVGGGVGAQPSIGLPLQADEYDFRETLHMGGGFSGRTLFPVPEDDSAAQVSASVYTGGTFSSETAIPVPQDAVQLPATTILRTGGVCTILSNISKGD